MTAQNTAEKKLNWARVLFSVFYVVVAIALFFSFRENMFYFKVEENSWNTYRFAWCCIGVFLGFATVAFALRCHRPSPFPEYLTHYPFQLAAMASLVFGGLHIFDATSGYLFYYLSFGLCFTLGYLVDSYWSFVRAIIDRSNKQ